MKSDEEKLMRDTAMQVDDMQNISRWRAFHTWLKDTEAWQRLVARKHRAKFLSWAIPVFGVLIWAQLLIEESAPVLKLEELDKRTGILADAGYSGKNRNRWITLSLPDSQTMRYNANTAPGRMALLQGLIGQPVTVWSQEEICIVPPQYENTLREIQHQETRLLGYDYEYRLRNHHVSIGWYVLPALMIVLPLLALWHLNREPAVTTQPTQERE